MIKLKGIMLISTQANGFPGIPGIPCMSLAVASCCVSLYSHLSTSHTPSLYSATPVMYAIHCALTVTCPGHHCMMDIAINCVSLSAGRRCILDVAVCWTLYAGHHCMLDVAIR